MQESFKLMSERVFWSNGMPQERSFPDDFPSDLLMRLVYVPSNGAVEAVAISRDFDDFLVSQNLVMPYFEHRKQIQAAKGGKTERTPSGNKYGAIHLAAITLIQKFATKMIIEPKRNAKARQFLRSKHQGKGALLPPSPEA